MEPTRAKLLFSQIITEFPDVKAEYLRERRLKITVSPDQIVDLAKFVKEELGFDYLSSVSGTDWIAKKYFEIIYFVETATRKGFEDFVIMISERISRESPSVPSLIQVWPAAEYHERETREMLGINFEGHPNLKKLLLPEDWNDLPPLRKDFVSPGR